MEPADVVVIGAGAAGLACARALLAAGRDPVVLEARGRVGGRLRTFRREGEHVELGAQVVHPTRGDLLRPALADAGLRTVPLPADVEVVVVEGGRRDEARTVAARRPPPPWVVEARLTALPDLDATVAEAVAVLPPPSQPAARAWLEQAVGGDADSIHVGSLAASRRDRHPGAEASVLGGFEQLAAFLARDVDVRTSAPVTGLRWDAGAVAVEVHGPVPLRARAVVVTGPPAVVAGGSVAFTPALPADRVRAAARLAAQDALVVVLESADPAPTSAWVLRVDEPGGLWTTRSGSRLVVGHLKAGAASRGRAVDWSGAGAAAVAAQVDPRLGDAVAVAVCDWGRDPWARGAFSLPVAGGDEAAALWATPLAGRLFFAGEACAERGERGLVQGALASGRRAAEEVIARPSAC